MREREKARLRKALDTLRNPGGGLRLVSHGFGDDQRPPAPVPRHVDHVHGCPSCYAWVPCDMVCTIESDLQRDDGTACGAYVTCDNCRFEWDGYCTRCDRGVSLDDDCDIPTTAREAVCHECDRILVREEALEEVAKLCEAHAEWAREPGRMPPEYRAGSVGAALGLAAEIRALAKPAPLLPSTDAEGK